MENRNCLVKGQY